MGAVFLSEENVHGESHLLPFNLEEHLRTGPLLFQGIDQVEGIQQGLAVDGNQHIPR